MTESIIEQLQHHADRLSSQLAEKLADARRKGNTSPALIDALQRAEAAAKALAQAAHEQGTSLHD